MKTTLPSVVCALALAGCAVVMHRPAPDRSEWATAPLETTCKTPKATHYLDVGLTAMYVGGGSVSASDGETNAAIVAFVIAGLSAGSAVYGFLNERECADFRAYQEAHPPPPPPSDAGVAGPVR